MNHEFSMLSTVDGPAALRSLAARELDALAREMRTFLVSKVSRTGGHLGPNLGIVELTIALHRVFDSPTDRIVFDTGHQAYVHKMITGRTAGFDRLRQRDGLSGYPSRAESAHDLVENSHASTALSYADGLAKAAALRGERRHIVAIVGDGALTGGMCWEAMNNIAAAKERPVVIVVNDNGRSYAPTLGGFAEHLASLRLSPGYEQFLDVVRKRLGGTPVVGPALYRLLHAAKEGLKDAFSPQALFDDLGIKYLGPVPGHDIGAVEHALRRARGFGQPVVVHVVTRKGNGFEPAEQDAAECLHSPPPFDPATGRPTAVPALTWTSVFADELVRIGRERDDVVAITAAMPGPTGVIRFAEAYPERFYDVGIAEQHAVTSAAGLAMGGIHPIVAVYSTFLNRAFDQILLDVALHRLPVTFVADRAGITGPDGPSHYGIWDLALFGMVPGLRIAAPRDADTLRAALREAMDVCDGPTLVRFPTGAAAPPLPVVESMGGVDVLYRPVTADALLVAVGAFASLAVAVAQHLSEQYGLLVVSPRWPLPVPAAVADLAREHEIVFTIEDGIRTGGVGDAVARALRDDRISAAVHTFGVPPGWHPPGSRAEVLASVGLTVEGVAAGIAGRLRENTVARL